MATREVPTHEERIVDWLAGLSDQRLAEVFYAAAVRRRSTGLADWRGHFVLAEAEKVGPDPWSVDFIALAREDVAEPGRVLAQSGRCGGCKTTVRSWARVATCPICSRTVYCS